MLCVQEKGLFFCHLLLFSCYLHTQTEILNLISSRLCALYFVHFAFRAFAHPFHVFVVTKAEPIINPHFVPGEIPKKEDQPLRRNSLVFSLCPALSSLQMEREEELQGTLLPGLPWLAVPSVGQSFWWHMFFLPTYSTVRKILVVR